MTVCGGSKGGGSDGAGATAGRSSEYIVRSSAIATIGGAALPIAARAAAPHELAASNCTMVLAPRIPTQSLLFIL